jgi:phosphatidate cytidylyltransferase
MSGAVLIVILFTCLYFGGWVTFGFSLFISLVGMYELIKVKKLEKTGLAVVGYIAAITYYFILLLNDPAYILLLLVASCILMMSVYVFTFPKYKTEDVMWVFFSIVYVAVTLSYIYQVRMLQDGIYIVWLIFVSSWGNDTCAYFTGVFLGKHKMTPKLSPKKTYEGAIGGVVGAAIKRNHDVKDYGKLIPGHGGIMDRFDSAIFTAPVVYWAIEVINKVFGG